MTTPPEVARTILTYQSQVASVRSQVLAFAERLWGGLSAWRDADIDRLVDALVPVSLGGQQRIAALTDAYMTAMATAAGLPVPVSGTPATRVTGEALRGVPPREVYRRAGVTVWSKLAEGQRLTDAVAAGKHRLIDMVATDLQLAKTKTAHAYMARDNTIRGYRRTLTGSENCAMCTLASTQRYHKAELAAIHPGCDCGVSPIRGNADPGQVISPARLEALHKAAAEQLGQSDRGGRAPDYRNIMVREHGELGPVLTIRGQHFDGPSSVS